MSDQGGIHTDQHLPADAAIEQLFNLYADNLYRFTLHSVGDPAEARDITQDVFYRALRGWHRFRNEAAPKTWLFQIARNCIRDSFRRQQKKNNDTVKGHAVTESSMETVETKIWLDGLLRQLSLNYRQVIALRFIEDLSIDETARVLRWSHGKVRTTQYRALRVLRSLVEESRR